MKRVFSLEELPHDFPNPVATIGNFDGVHLGHQKLMRLLVERAAAISGTPTVITFQPHPLQLLAPGNAPQQIQTLDQRLAMLELLGIRLAVVIPFNRELAQIRAKEFALDILWKKLGLKEIYVGPNFAFGNRREGSFGMLKEIGQEKGFSVGKIPQMQFRGSRVSSTAVRQALFSGQAAFARRLLGRPYTLEGVVIHGSGIGHDIGFPTANLETVNELIPRWGVYATILIVDRRRFMGVANIGVRPTVGSELSPSIEIHALDFDRDIYGKKATIQFIMRLREEKKFPDIHTLTAQIRKDIERARRYFDWVQRRVPSIIHEPLDTPKTEIE